MVKKQYQHHSPKIAANVTPKKLKIYQIQRQINARSRLREMHTNNVDNVLDDVDDNDSVHVSEADEENIRRETGGATRNRHVTTTEK